MPQPAIGSVLVLQTTACISEKVGIFVLHTDCVKHDCVCTVGTKCTYKLYNGITVTVQLLAFPAVHPSMFYYSCCEQLNLIAPPCELSRICFLVEKLRTCEARHRIVLQLFQLANASTIHSDSTVNRGFCPRRTFERICPPCKRCSPHHPTLGYERLPPGNRRTDRLAARNTRYY